MLLLILAMNITTLNSHFQRVWMLQNACATQDSVLENLDHLLAKGRKEQVAKLKALLLRFPHPPWSDWIQCQIPASDSSLLPLQTLEKSVDQIIRFYHPWETMKLNFQLPVLNSAQLQMLLWHLYDDNEGRKEERKKGRKEGRKLGR